MLKEFTSFHAAITHVIGTETTHVYSITDIASMGRSVNDALEEAIELIPPNQLSSAIGSTIAAYCMADLELMAAFREVLTTGKPNALANVKSESSRIAI